MNEKTAVVGLTALAHETRLRIFRTLIGAGPDHRRRVSTKHAARERREAAAQRMAGSAWRAALVPRLRRVTNPTQPLRGKLPHVPDEDALVKASRL